MKKLLTLSLLASTVAFGHPADIPRGFSITVPTLYTSVTLDQQLFAAVEEEAVQFLAAEGKVEVSDQLRAALDSVKQKMEEESQIEVTDVLAAQQIIYLSQVTK